MKKFEDLKHKPHSNWEGTQAKMFFPNGYGVSVIRAGDNSAGGWSGSYGGEQGLYELAVLVGDIKDSKITYATHITTDVEGHLTTVDVTKLMEQVQTLAQYEV